MNTADPHTAPPAAPVRPPSRGTSALGWLLLLVVLPLAAALGWRAWQAEAESRRAAHADEALRVDAVERRVATLRGRLQAQGQRLQQAEATNRLLRDELLAIGQRAALLEDSVQRLADPAHDVARQLRLDEVELLLAQGEARLVVAGDLDGARRAYALAARLLDALTDPGDIDLRQLLAQERAALDALGEDPRLTALARLDAVEAALDGMPRDAGAKSTPADADRDAGGAWWQRLARRIVDVRRSDDHLAVAAGDRAAGLAALRLELALARAAAERRDARGHAAALARAAGWLPRLWPDSPQRAALRAELEAVAALPLAVARPETGTTAAQIRRLRTRHDGQ